MFLKNRTFSPEPRAFRPQALSLRRCYGPQRHHQIGAISATQISTGHHEANNPAAIPLEFPSSPLLPRPTADAPNRLHVLHDLVRQAGLILSMVEQFVEPSLKD